MSDFPTEVDGPPLTCGFIVADYETLHIAPAANVNKRCKTVVRGRTIKRALVPGKMVDAMKRRARQRQEEAAFFEWRRGADLMSSAKLRAGMLAWVPTLARHGHSVASIHSLTALDVVEVKSILKARTSAMGGFGRVTDTLGD